jgi:hypothetical protein
MPRRITTTEELRAIIAEGSGYVFNTDGKELHPTAAKASASDEQGSAARSRTIHRRAAASRPIAKAGA